MFKKETIPFSSSGVLNPLVKDYLNRHEELNSFYSFFPDEKGFKTLLETKPYQNFDRIKLVQLLTDQASLVANTKENSLLSIKKLQHKNTYTVCTGHQLCLFTGPLYFIYKIITTINLSEKLKQKFPEFDFVPIYWMASEDHDFEEVNHFNGSGKTIRWNSEQKGAVGDFDTGELKALLGQVTELFGISDKSAYLTSLFEKAYLQHKNLSDATRYLVNELFGEKGLVIMDGNDVGFKVQFKKQFTEDLFKNTAFGEVNSSITSLSKLTYNSQVNPRKINCFYLEKGIRSRIEKEGDSYKVLGTEIRFTEKELQSLIEEHPEKLSPNVVLRPLYQQVILPNIAYIGGPGELAYWLEFKAFFTKSDVFFPILMPRNFVLLVDQLTDKKINKLQFTIEDLFGSEQSLSTQLQIRKNAVIHLDEETERLKKIYSSLTEKVKAIDSTLMGSSAAEEKRALNGLDRLRKKANRALKRGSETENRQIKEIKTRLFPKAVPQERFENFSGFYLSHGPTFFETLLKELDPFLQEQYIFTESD